jgi:hypothetical protein
MGILKRYDNMDDINPVKHMIEAQKANKYVRIGSDLSVTEMTNSPRIVQLANRYPDKLKKDTIESSLPALLGTSTHDMFERYLRAYDVAHPNTYLLERRMLTVQEAASGRLVRVAGRFDILERRHILWDIKQTSTFKFVRGNVDDFEKQLNIYAYMLQLDGIKVDTLKILAVFPDWNKWERQRQGGSYPPNKMTAYKFELWPFKERHDYFVDRINLHDAASVVPDDQLPLCTDEDMWAAPTKWAVYASKQARKASRLFEDKADALAYVNNMQDSATAIIRERPGKRTRCADWCKCSPVCQQYKDFLKQLP